MQTEHSKVSVHGVVAIISNQKGKTYVDYNY